MQAIGPPWKKLPGTRIFALISTVPKPSILFKIHILGKVCSVLQKGRAKQRDNKSSLQNSRFINSFHIRVSCSLYQLVTGLEVFPIPTCQTIERTSKNVQRPRTRFRISDWRDRGLPMEPQWVTHITRAWGADILPCYNLSSGPHTNCWTSLSWLVPSISIAQRQLWGSHFCGMRPMWSKKTAISLGDSRHGCFPGKPLSRLTVKKPVQPQISYISNSTAFLSDWTSAHGIIISMVSVSLQMLGSISPSAALFIHCDHHSPAPYCTLRASIVSQAKDGDTQPTPLERWKRTKYASHFRTFLWTFVQSQIRVGFSPKFSLC